MTISEFRSNRHHFKVGDHICLIEIAHLLIAPFLSLMPPWVQDNYKPVLDFRDAEIDA